MTEEEFLKYISGGKCDIVGLLLQMLGKTSANYCVIGGLAVNAYAEPVVSLDLDVVLVADKIEAFVEIAKRLDFNVERFKHSINLKRKDSGLRIQIQSDPRYQAFLPRAKMEDVLGYRLRVAELQDVFQGKLWAYSDSTRRKSKRQKDLADILRLIETHPELEANLPNEIKRLVS